LSPIHSFASIVAHLYKAECGSKDSRSHTFLDLLRRFQLPAADCEAPTGRQV
jgi:hypothetical protein